jgi:hypothetical protein
MKGVASWNAWREENRDIRPDLIRAKPKPRVAQSCDLTWARTSAGRTSPRRTSDTAAASRKKLGCACTFSSLSLLALHRFDRAVYWPPLRRPHRLDKVLDRGARESLGDGRPGHLHGHGARRDS